ncbi:hypothetical protein ROHU_018441 [Labeo rohita]|uniref:Uncharacterized protein n=1 Tax=Labeo rohita TaxID=84645 RepID=A0A498NEW1_LABRO|nr:hypothetical protein ROHU_018441 [Labeo rohita]
MKVQDRGAAPVMGLLSQDKIHGFVFRRGNSTATAKGRKPRPDAFRLSRSFPSCLLCLSAAPQLEVMPRDVVLSASGSLWTSQREKDTGREGRNGGEMMDLLSSQEGPLTPCRDLRAGTISCPCISALSGGDRQMVYFL